MSCIQLCCLFLSYLRKESGGSSSDSGSDSDSDSELIGPPLPPQHTSQGGDDELGSLTHASGTTAHSDDDDEDDEGEAQDDDDDVCWK